MRVFRGSSDVFSRVLRKRPACLRPVRALMLAVAGNVVERDLAVARRSIRTPSCQDCFFGRSGLCALPEPAPCATFRPYHPDGLRPPAQLRLTFRTERRTRAAWAFPTAQQQAERYGHDLFPTGPPAPVYGLPASDPESAPCPSDSQFSVRAPRWQDRDGACSGYLARLGEFRLLIDCCLGVFAKLRVHDYQSSWSTRSCSRTCTPTT